MYIFHFGLTFVRKRAELFILLTKTLMTSGRVCRIKILGGLKGGKGGGVRIHAKYY